MRQQRAVLATAVVLLLLITGCGRGEGGDAGSSSEAAVAAYEEGMEALNRRSGLTDVEASVAAFERAVEADPEFTAAWSGLAQARMWLQWNLGVPDQLPLAEAAAARAAELDPDAKDTHLALEYVDYWGHGDLDGALGHFQAAEAISADDAEVAGAIGNIHRRKGRLDEAIAAYERRVEIAPSHAQGLATLAGTYDAVGRYGDSREVADRLVSLGDARGHVRRFWSSFHAGDTASAWEHIPAIQEAQGRSGEPGYFAFLQAYVRQDVAAGSALMEAIGTEDIGLGLFTYMAMHLGTTGQAAARTEFFDYWVGEHEARLDENPDSDRARLNQANLHSNLALLEALRGNRQAALTHIAAVEAIDPASLDAWLINPVADVILARAVLEEDDQALAGLEDLAARGLGFTTGWLVVEPSFDGLRDHPRFQAIMAQRAAREQAAM